MNTTVSHNTVKTTGSASGGGILNYGLGTLTLINSTVSENEVEGDPANGGGIVNFGTLTLARSTVENNVANSSALVIGGGILNFRTLSLDQSTVLRNTMSSSTQDGLGGGIINYPAASTTILNNSTITLNAAQGRGGGIAAIASGSVFIMYSTLYENKATFGGGVYIEGNNPNGTNAVTLEASIVAGNTAEKGPDIFGTLTLLDPSLIEHVPDPDTTLIYGTDPQNPSAYTLTKRSIFGSSPKLGSLQTDGASTPFYPLLPDSPAIDQIPLNNAGECDVTPVFETTPDQRGIMRPQGKGYDLGAYESSY